MAAKKFRTVAYQLTRGDDTDDPDVEANLSDLFHNGQQNERTNKNGTTGQEAVPMNTINDGNPSGTNAVGYKNDKDERNEDNDPTIGNVDTGNKTDNGTKQAGNPVNENSFGITTSDLVNTTVAANKKMKDFEIHEFAREGDVTSCSKLLSQPHVDVNLRNRKGMTALHLAAQNGHEEIVSLLLSHSDTGNRTDNRPGQSEDPVNEINSGTDILHPVSITDVASNAVAQRKKQDSEIHTLEGKSGGANCSKLVPNVHVNRKVKNGMTALHLAAMNGHEMIVTLLLSHEANKYMKDTVNFLPMHYAARYGYLTCVQVLLRRCSHNDQQLSGKTKSGRTALMEAAEFGHQECCKMLLEINVDKVDMLLGVNVDKVDILLGVNVDEVDNERNTALHYAAKGEHTNIVVILLDSKAHPTKENKYGITPLHEAAMHESISCLEPFFDVALPDVLPVDGKGNSILHSAVTQRSAKCLNYLLNILKKEYVKEVIDKEAGPFGTLLLYAISLRVFKCVTALLHAGASPSHGVNGTYPIIEAAEWGCHSICEKMLEKNSEIIKQMNKYKQTPLHAAILSGNIDTVNLICNKIRLAQINPSSQETMGRTALHMAAEKADEKIMSRLLKENVAVRKQDLRGFSALHVAAELGKKRCCEILVKKDPTTLQKPNKNGLLPLDLAFQNMEKNQETIIYLLKETFPKSKTKLHKQRNPCLMHMRCSMKIYMHKALQKELRYIVDAIIDSSFWEDSLLGGKALHPENFISLVKVYPELALKVQSKYIKSESRDCTTFGFALFEDNYYILEERSPFEDKTGKLKKDALEHHPDVYSWTENHPVNQFIDNKEYELLKHPLTRAWLRNKWKSYIMYIHYVLLLLEGIYLGFLVWLMASSWNWIHINNVFNITKDEFCEASNQLHSGSEITAELNATALKSLQEFEEKVDPYSVVYYLVVFSWMMKVLLVLFYIGRLRHLYWRREMLPHVGIEISQLVLTTLVLYAPLGMCYNRRLGLLQEDWAWQCGIIAVLFAWLHLINSINQARTSVFLPITVDFLEVLVKGTYFLVTFIGIFAFLFHLLLLEQDSFGTFFQSIGSTIVWMLLDLGYTDTFVEKQLSYPLLTNVIFFLFITTIGFLIVSLITRERIRKAKGKELDNRVRRLVIYTQLIFRYDICCPRWIRRRFTVNKCTYNLENCMGEGQTGVSYDNKEVMEYIKKIELLILDISDQNTHIRLQLSNIGSLNSKEGVEHRMSLK